MQDSMFIGLDVHKATISVAIARGETWRGNSPLGNDPASAGPCQETGGEVGCGRILSAFWL